MERRNTMIRLTLAWLLPGALLGAIVGLLVVYLGSRQKELVTLSLTCTGFGAVFGGLVGALLADHKCPP